jgi:hypothetical protein
MVGAGGVFCEPPFWLKARPLFRPFPGPCLSVCVLATTLAELACASLVELNAR